MRRPRTEEELLEREQALAVAGIVSTAEHMVDDASRASGLAETFRKHPAITAAVAAVGGWAVARTLLRAGRTALNAYLARPRLHLPIRRSRLAAWLGR